MIERDAVTEVIGFLVLLGLAIALVTALLRRPARVRDFRKDGR